MKSIKLLCKTDPKWVRVILDHFDEFLADHADCERKASAMAMFFVAKCGNRTDMVPAMVDLALEELVHFRQVYVLMQKRGLRLPEKIINDPYVNALLKHCRNSPEERFLDRLLTVGLVEARGAERFRIVAQALKDPELKRFYQGLYRAEAKHGDFFLKIALRYFNREAVESRLRFLAQEEAKIIRELEWRPSLH